MRDNFPGLFFSNQCCAVNYFPKPPVLTTVFFRLNFFTWTDRSRKRNSENLEYELGGTLLTHFSNTFMMVPDNTDVVHRVLKNGAKLLSRPTHLWEANIKMKILDKPFEKMEKKYSMD